MGVFNLASLLYMGLFALEVKNNYKGKKMISVL